MESQSCAMKTLALFDFDGTITTRDSFAAFLPFVVGWPRFLWGLLILSPVIAAYGLRLISNSTAKQKIFSHFFKGRPLQKFESCCRDFANKSLPRLMRPHALKRLRWHKEEGHAICIVSASFENYLKPWADIEGYDVIATQLSVADKKITGRFSSANCFGPEKVERIRIRYDLSLYKSIYAYGDSRGDKEMLALATERYFNWKKME